MKDSWQARTPGTFELTQFVNPGTNGACEDLGEFATLRAATEAARRIAKISKLQGGFMASECRSHKREGAAVDGVSHRIALEPGPYFPSLEITLSDGRVVWLEDVDEALRTILDTPV